MAVREWSGFVQSDRTDPCISPVSNGRIALPAGRSQFTRQIGSPAGVVFIRCCDALLLRSEPAN